ncbi:outer membrane protein transport protein [Photobacterium sp. SDRW27]|uniref:OmpP1/FadL family transporter n=1 Tax=Photobacterium obscurum TaxID=2829490 RepID=UPI002243FA62|nr:outer membrane protein transport protein [Photobacterium obscurum]MCW8327476.1 outer membrane protein transport protein [Photobacterium obscurum]
MKKHKLAVAVAIAGVLSGGCGNASAAGFQIVEHSASGLGRAFSGEAAIADNAAALARNPASLSLLKETNITTGLAYIDPDIQMEFSNGQFVDAIEDEAAPPAFVPNFYLSHPLNDKVTIGFGSYADFGLASEFSDEVNEEFGTIAGDTSVTVINLNTSLAYELNEQFVVGASASLLLAQAELNRHSGIAKMVTGGETDVFANLEGNGIGFGYKVGALYKLNDNHRWGIAYTGASDIDMEGEFNGVQLNTEDNILDYVEGVDGELTLNLPSILEVSGYHQLTDQFAVHYSWMRTGWSSFQEILATSKGNECSSKGENDKVCLQKEEGWKDSNRYSLGATYQINGNWTIRSGVAFDETPTDKHVTASIPDSDRIWYSAGMSYRRDRHNIDFGLTYLEGETGDVIEEEGKFFKTTNCTAMIYAIQYSYTFK